MPEWKVRLKAVIDDDMIVEAETAEEAKENAERDWSFVEASQWETISVLRVGGDDDDE